MFSSTIRQTDDIGFVCIYNNHFAANNIDFAVIGVAASVFSDGYRSAAIREAVNLLSVYYFFRSCIGRQLWP